MAKRSISQRQLAWLTEQLGDWHSAGLLSADQSAQILDLYDTPADLAEHRRSIALLTLMGVAAFLVGLGSLLLIGYNWEAMPDAVRLLIIFGVLLGTYAGAFLLRFKWHAKGLSEVVFLLGGLFYGAAIFLIAQIFHLDAHYPNGMWWWAVGILPVALCLDTILLQALLVALLATWCGMEVLGFGDLGLGFFRRWWFVPNGAYSLLPLALPGLLWAYRKKSVATVALYVSLIAWWTILQPFAWRQGLLSVYFIGTVGALMLVVAECHARGNRFAIPYRTVGILLTAGVLLVLSSYYFNAAIPYAAQRTGRFTLTENEAIRLLPTLVAVVLSALVIYVVALIRVRTSGESCSVIEQAWQVVRHQWVPVGVVVLMIALLFWHLLDGAPLLPTLLANVAMIAFSVWLIELGLREDHGQLFASGVIYFLLWAVVRYIDLFGMFFGMLGAALMFFWCGGTLFYVALFWHRRRQSKNG